MFDWLTRRSFRNFFPPVHKADGSQTRIFVGISGGVDSSVSAALLRQQGYDVTGVFMKTYYPPEIQCDWREERLDAVRVCEHLAIPFLECDLEEVYKKNVFDYMVASYQSGITPNPDIFCNKYVKFGGFLEWSIQQGADYVATGHYAQHIRKKSEFGVSGGLHKVGLQGENFEHQLVMGQDSNKDQTYFLYQLQQRQLEHIIFPVGDIPKKQVRRLANRFGLFTATKKDSQGLCFVGPVDMQDFLSRYINEQPGDVLDTSLNVIGSHRGSFFLTIGQRTGFEIFPQYRTPEMPRMFIVSKDSTHNTITVSPDKHTYENQRITISQASWVHQPIKIGETVQSRIRHRGTLLPATLESINDDRYVLYYDQVHTGVAPGQSVVLYRDTICVGGGVIV